MSLQVSTGFKIRILGSDGFLDIFDGGALFIYGGARPAQADFDDAPGILLAVASNAGLSWDFEGSPNGLHFSQEGPYILKNGSQQWMMHTIASGTATWFRLYAAEAGGHRGVAYDLSRIDGDIQITGSGIPAEMYLADTSLDAGTLRAVEYFLFTIPPILS